MQKRRTESRPERITLHVMSPAPSPPKTGDAIAGFTLQSRSPNAEPSRYPIRIVARGDACARLYRSFGHLTPCMRAESDRY
jgi:hypothetical protein